MSSLVPMPSLPSDSSDLETTKATSGPADRCNEMPFVLHSWETACQRGSVLSFGRAVRCG